MCRPTSKISHTVTIIFLALRSVPFALLPFVYSMHTGRHRKARDVIKRKRGIHEEWRYSITPKTTAWESGVRNNTKQTASGGGY